MPIVTTHIDEILHARLEARARKRFGEGADAFSDLIKEALAQYLSPASAAAAAPSAKPAKLFSIKEYEEKVKNQPPVPEEWVQTQLASIKIASISTRAPYVRPDGQMKRIPFQLPESLDEKIQRIVPNYENSRWMNEEYGAIETSTIIRDQIARVLLVGLPLKPEPPTGGRIFGLSVNARLAQLLQDRLSQLKATGETRKNAGLATLIKQALTAALYHPHDDLVS